MRSQGTGRIILIGSIGGLIALPYLAYYCASKFALDGFVEALRPEIKPFGIQATALHPGDFNTNLGANRQTSAQSNVASPYSQAVQTAVGF